MFEVLIETANRDPRQVRCLNTACGIGRGEDNLVMLQGWNIAREHATLSARRNGVFIEVLSARAPIAVNGNRVQSEHGPLHRDDLVTIGAYRLRVLADPVETDVQVTTQASNAPDVGPTSAPPRLPHPRRRRCRPPWWRRRTCWSGAPACTSRWCARWTCAGWMCAA